jgi:glycosyltransferase involved in cell wall biosynthesis
VYRLDASLALYSAARKRLPGLRLLFIGGGRPEIVFREAVREGVALSSDDLRFVAAERPQVPRWLGAGDIGLCFCTPTFSSIGVSPTKVGEYLACGLPVVGNAQIGDFERIVHAVGAGHTLPDLGRESIKRAAEALPRLLNANRNDVRAHARRFLGLDKGVAAYRRIYGDLGRAVSLEP